MPTLDKHLAKERTKLLLLGDSGSGKTSAIASLANAGYNLRVLDFDDGLDILLHLVKPEFHKNVNYVTLRDNLKDAKAFKTAMSMLLTEWKDGDTNLGRIASWGAKDVLVLDSLTFMGLAALRHVLVFNNHKPTDQPSRPEWGQAARDVETIISYITGGEVPCNVVVTSHIRYIEDANGGGKAYPTSVGATLSTIISRYFNCVVRIDVKNGKEGNRVLRTQSDYKMDLKTPAPDKIPVEMEVDLAKLFAAIQQNGEKR